MSDSQAALKALDGFSSNSSTVNDCRRSLNEKAERQDIHIIWELAETSGERTTRHPLSWQTKVVGTTSRHRKHRHRQEGYFAVSLALSVARGALGAQVDAGGSSMTPSTAALT